MTCCEYGPWVPNGAPQVIRPKWLLIKNALAYYRSAQSIFFDSSEEKNFYRPDTIDCFSFVQRLNEGLVP